MKYFAHINRPSISVTLWEGRATVLRGIVIRKRAQLESCLGTGWVDLFAHKCPGMLLLCMLYALRYTVCALRWAEEGIELHMDSPMSEGRTLT